MHAPALHGHASEELVHQGPHVSGRGDADGVAEDDFFDAELEQAIRYGRDL